MKAFERIVLVVCLLLLGGCASGVVEQRLPDRPADGTAAQPRRIVLMMDGTGNDESTATNVWRLKEMIKVADPQAGYAYFSGVGTAGPELSAQVLGLGMEKIVQQAYDYLAASYRPGDSVYVFGFSRGAHQARAFVGFVAYAGLVSATDRQRHGARLTNRLLEMTKQFDDDWFASQWRAGGSDGSGGGGVDRAMAPPLAQRIRQQVGVDVAAVPIEFVGLWDTVPGSWFKDYGACAELPDAREGQRYKTGSYPNTKRIAHAVAADEKRSKFRPILLCEPIAPERTLVRELWFAGAHADIGGGYGDDPTSGLPGLSLAWMLEQLDTSWQLPVTPRPVGNPMALAHWSMGDFPANAGSTCGDRALPSEPERLHPSLLERRRAGTAPLRVSGRIDPRHVDPPACPRP